MINELSWAPEYWRNKKLYNSTNDFRYILPHAPQDWIVNMRTDFGADSIQYLLVFSKFRPILKSVRLSRNRTDGAVGGIWLTIISIQFNSVYYRQLNTTQRLFLDYKTRLMADTPEIICFIGARRMKTNYSISIKFEMVNVFWRIKIRFLYLSHHSFMFLIFDCFYANSPL